MTEEYYRRYDYGHGCSSTSVLFKSSTGEIEELGIEELVKPMMKKVKKEKHVKENKQVFLFDPEKLDI